MTIQGLRQTWNESVSAVTATKSTDLDLGTIRYEDGRTYQYVYNKGGSDAGIGYGVCLSAGTGYSVTVSAVTEVDACFGVVYNATLTANYYGWIVKNGFVPLEAHADSVLAVGDFVSLGALGVCSKAQAGVSQLKFGQVAQATASGGSAYGYVNCL